MRDRGLSALELEILDTLVDSDETTALILRDLRNPHNAASFSERAKELDFARLDAVFRQLAERGLVAAKQEPTDGFALPRPGVSFTWWSLTDEGRRTWEAYDATQPG